MGFFDYSKEKERNAQFHDALTHAEQCLTEMNQIFEKASRLTIREQINITDGWELRHGSTKRLLTSQASYERFISLHKEIENCLSILKSTYRNPMLWNNDFEGRRAYGELGRRVHNLQVNYSLLISRYNRMEKYIDNNI